MREKSSDNSVTNRTKCHDYQKVDSHGEISITEAVIITSAVVTRDLGLIDERSHDDAHFPCDLAAYCLHAAGFSSEASTL